MTVEHEMRAPLALEIRRRRELIEMPGVEEARAFAARLEVEEWEVRERQTGRTSRCGNDRPSFDCEGSSGFGPHLGDVDNLETETCIGEQRDERLGNRRLSGRPDMGRAELGDDVVEMDVGLGHVVVAAEQ